MVEGANRWQLVKVIHIKSLYLNDVLFGDYTDYDHYYRAIYC